MLSKRSNLAPRGRRVVRFRPSEETIAVVDEIAALSGRSRSAIMSDLMDEVAPVLRAQFEAMRRVAETPERAAEVIANLAEEGRAKIAQAELEFSGGQRKGKSGAKP